MGSGASKSTTVYRAWRTRRFAMNRMIASSKTENCTGAKTAAIRSLNEMALEMDSEHRVVLSARAEGLRQMCDDQVRRIEDFVRIKRLEFAPMRGNPAAMRAIASNERFRRFVVDYKRMSKDLQTYKKLLKQTDDGITRVDTQIGRWRQTLALAQYDTPGYDVTELLTMTTGYINSQPIDTSAEAQRLAGEDFDDAVAMSQEQFGIDSGESDDKSEMATLVRLLFNTPEDAPPVYAQQGAAVMTGVHAASAEEDDFYLFATDRSRSLASASTGSKRGNQFSITDSLY